LLCKKDYDDALHVQDASNITGVAHSYVPLLERMETERESNKLELNRHPLAVMWASKLLSLSKGELQPTQDLRILPGWHLMLYARCLSTSFQKMRQLGDQEYGLTVDNKFLDGHILTRWMCVQIAQLTCCEHLDVFGQAYDVCKRISQAPDDEACDIILDDDSAHRVMIPDMPVEKQPLPDEESDVDWACECGATGVTRMLEFVEATDTFKCNQCGSQNITAVSHTLKAELHTPRMLAFAMGQLNADKVQAAGHTLSPLVSKG